MGRVLYVECAAGAAGDMLLGALIDAGLPVDALDQALGTLHVDHRLRISTVVRAGLRATRFEVESAAGAVPAHGPGDSAHGDHEHPTGHRTLAEIGRLIDHSALSPAARARAQVWFDRLAREEAAVHGVPVADVHLHEVGSLDSIVDVVGFAFALEWFDIEEVVASPLNVGGGTVAMAHGTYPVPAPATARLLAGTPIYSRGPQVELLTPTGALLVIGSAARFGPMPAMTLRHTGCGAGQRDFPEIPNVVRVFIGEAASEAQALGQEAVLKIECEIDDMNPQLFGAASERLFDLGALDVVLTAVQMKKGRPGTRLTVLSAESQRGAIVETIFRETTTLGVRIERVWRETLDRTLVVVSLPDGEVRVKVSGRNGKTYNAMPEYEDCLRIARATGRPIRQVQADVLTAWRTATSPSRG